MRSGHVGQQHEIKTDKHLEIWEDWRWIKQTLRAKNQYANQKIESIRQQHDLQAEDLETTAKRDYITLAHLWERQPEGPTCIWYGLHNSQRTTMVKGWR
jgi:hypothetical protein